MKGWYGFVIGVAAGFILTVIAVGKVIVVDYTSEFKLLGYAALFAFFIIGQAITVISAKNNKSTISPAFDGFLSGVSFIEAITIFVLYGFRL